MSKFVSFFVNLCKYTGPKNDEGGFELLEEDFEGIEVEETPSEEYDPQQSIEKKNQKLCIRKRTQPERRLIKVLYRIISI
ncbi:MAG: hypothetical protein GX115_03705 [Ruminiclostridium sp.]|nr:hypothetical protein [Ruminiclostridium sp.]